MDLRLLESMCAECCQACQATRGCGLRPLIDLDEADRPLCFSTFTFVNHVLVSQIEEDSERLEYELTT